MACNYFYMHPNTLNGFFFIGEINRMLIYLPYIGSSVT